MEAAAPGMFMVSASAGQGQSKMAFAGWWCLRALDRLLFVGLE